MRMLDSDESSLLESVILLEILSLLGRKLLVLIDFRKLDTKGQGIGKTRDTRTSLASATLLCHDYILSFST